MLLLLLLLLSLLGRLIQAVDVNRKECLGCGEIAKDLLLSLLSLLELIWAVEFDGKGVCGKSVCELHRNK